MKKTIITSVAACIAAFALAGCQTDGSGGPSLSLGGGSGKVIEHKASAGPARTGAVKVGAADPVVMRPMLLQGLDVMEAPALEKYLNGVLVRLVEQWPDQAPPMRVYLSTSPGFQAEGGVDGGIFLTLGTLDNLKTEDEVAFILAHEAAHLLLTHQRDRGGANDAARKTTATADTVLGAVDQFSQFAPVNSELAGKASQYRLLANAGLEASETLVFPSWSRGQEEEADLLGIDLMMRAGYSPVGAVKVFELLKSEDEKRKVQKAQATQAANQNSNTGAAMNAAMGVAAQHYDDTGLASTFLSNFGGEISQAMSGLKDDHGASADRLENAREYLKREYAGVRPAIRQAPWDAAMAEPTTARIMEGHRKVNTAMMSLGTQGAAAAKSTLAGIKAQEVKKSPHYLFADALRLNAEGQSNTAKARLETATKSPNATLRVYRALIEKSSKAESAKVLKLAQERLGNPPALYPDAIRLARADGRMADATATLAQCKLHGDAELLKLCEGAN